MDEESKGFIAHIVAITISIILVLKLTSAPILDDKEKNPFIVKKAKVSWVFKEGIKYYGRMQKNQIFPPHTIILKERYNVGDTIYFKK